MPRTLNRGPQGGTASEGRINIYPSQASSPSSPSPENGDLYFNTSVREWFYYDQPRTAWLTTSSFSLSAGRNGNVTAGSFFRGINGMLLDATNRGMSVPQGTVVGLSATKTSTAASDIEVLVNGVVVTTFTLGGSPGSTESFTLSDNFPQGVLSFRNAAGGATVRNVQIVLWYKRRA